ncbi:metal-dependent hydrolase, partial [Flavobacteriales bacterium]|nr:metal-dependent hydrolase [Flavobacteriales bacterium]
MDSLTQIVLGASVGELVLGKKIGNKAILWGAIAGTIPDLDVLLRYFTDEISATEMHRGFSHSIIFAVLIAPILGWLTKKIHFKINEVSFKDWTKLFFWTTVTHPLLDAHTTWGTQFFWPLNYRLAYQNIFVVDPLYTLPFLFFLILTFCYQKKNSLRSKFNKIG